MQQYPLGIPEIVGGILFSRKITLAWERRLSINGVIMSERRWKRVGTRRKWHVSHLLKNSFVLDTENMNTHSPTTLPLFRELSPPVDGCGNSIIIIIELLWERTQYLPLLLFCSGFSSRILSSSNGRVRCGAKHARQTPSESELLYLFPVRDFCINFIFQRLCNDSLCDKAASTSLIV